MKIRAGEKELDNVKVIGLLLIWTALVSLSGALFKEALTPVNDKAPTAATEAVTFLATFGILLAGIFVANCALKGGKLPWLRKH